MAIKVSIQALLAGKQVAGSKLGDKLLDELMSEGLLSVVVRGTKKSYRAQNVDALRRFFIDKDERYRILDVGATDSRALMAAETGNSKLIMVRSCPGFPINSCEPIECLLNGKSVCVNPPEGSFMFITDWEEFVIPKDVVVVGIENMENFRRIRKQKVFMEEYLQAHGFSTRAIYVSRYPQSTDLRKWLLSISNHYLHFGDFDLAGIHIFLSEFQKYLGSERSSILIPNDIELRLKSGSDKRYDEQYARFKDLKSENQDIQWLINCINHNRKGYDQEGYIDQ